MSKFNITFCHINTPELEGVVNTVPATLTREGGWYDQEIGGRGFLSRTECWDLLDQGCHIGRDELGVARVIITRGAPIAE